MNLLPELWRLILTNSLRGSVFIAGVLLLRALLRGRVPAQCFHLLWLLVAVRLLTPVAPSSPWSVFNLRPAAPLAGHEQAPGTTPEWRVQLAGGSTASPIPSPVIPVQPLARRRDFRARLPALWLAGALVQVVSLATGALLWRRRLRASTDLASGAVLSLAEECAGEIGWRGRLRLRETDLLSSPAVFGLWRPCLYLPRGLAERLDEPALRCVLLHELTHLRRRDLAALWLLAGARAVHWFNPLVWLAVRCARLDTELACDEAVLGRMEAGGRLRYGDALLQLARATVLPRPALAAGMVESGRALRTRLRRIVAYGPGSRTRWLAGLLVAALAAVALAADEKPSLPAVPPAPSPEPAKSAPIATAPSPASGRIVVEVPAVITPLPAATPAPKPNAALPKWAEGWEVRGITIPASGDMRDAFVDFKSPTGRDVTLTTSIQSKEGPVLANVEWTGAPVRGRVTLKQGEETASLLVEPALIARKDEVKPVVPQVFIQFRLFDASTATFKKLLGGMKGMEQFASPSPALGAVTGVLTPPEADALVRLIQATSGTDSLAGPSVTTKSGQAAMVEIIREFKYASEYDPRKKGEPWVVRATETRNVGVTLNVTASLQEGGVIEVDSTPKVCEFLGFVHAVTGKPLSRQPDFTTPLLTRVAKSMSEKAPPPAQPVFSTREVHVTLDIFDGQTIVFANLRETDMTSPFKPPGEAGHQLMALITARRVVPGEPPR